jgi:hypothetical protein
MSVADGHPTDSMFIDLKEGTQLMDIYPLSYKSKYERWYYSIIANAKCQPRSKGGDVYYESHHIVPKSLGGCDSYENLVLLTAREHFICHWLLYKFSEGNTKHKMAHAWFMMCSVKNNNQHRYVPSARIYEAAKIAKSLSPVSDETRKKQSKAQIGKTMPEKTRKKISRTTRGRSKSDSHRKKLSESLKGKKKSKEHLEKISQARTGMKWTEEQKENLKKVRPSNGKNNPIFSGWYITPWGSYETPQSAKDNAPFKIAEAGIRKYCKYNNEKVITNNNPIRSEYVGKTPKELGFGFKERAK